MVHHQTQVWLQQVYFNHSEGTVLPKETYSKKNFLTFVTLAPGHSSPILSQDIPAYDKIRSN